MKKIVGILRPFDFNQTLYVYEDGNKIDIAKPTIEELPETIVTLANQYDISNIDLTGPKQYSRGIKRQIEENAVSRFKNMPLEIEII